MSQRSKQELIQEASDADIPVVTVLTDDSSSARISFVGLSTLGQRCSSIFGYQFSEIVRSLMSVYFCGYNTERVRAGITIGDTRSAIREYAEQSLVGSTKATIR